jgi:hypothetical protein
LGASEHVAASAEVDAKTPAQVAREFRAVLAGGAVLRPAGAAKRRPRALLARYRPRYAVELFATRFYLTDVRQNDDIRFFVAYLAQRDPRGRTSVYPRIFYKDVSLVWRSASHYVRSATDNWIGKGEAKTVVQDGVLLEVSDEATTDLPLELQPALETLTRRIRRIRRDEQAVPLVLRKAGGERIEAFADFTAPRRRAREERRGLVNGGRPIARFARRNDPTSLRFAPGFEPDFRGGVLEVHTSTSKLYGGALQRFRILSRNRQAQYLFMAGAHQVWIPSCQATRGELTSYGVRVVDAKVDDDLLVPGYEYHFLDQAEDPPAWVSQIPPGFAGEPSPLDATRCDASPWLEQLPVIRDFRRLVLASASARAASQRRA